MSRHFFKPVCLAIAAVAFVSTAAIAQPAPPPDPATITMSAEDNSAVILSLAEVLRDRFAFRERGIAVSLEIEAMEKRGDFRDAKTAAVLLDLIKTRISPMVDDRHFRVRYMGPEIMAGFSDLPPNDEQIAEFHEEVRLRGGEIPEIRWLDGNVGYLRITRFLNAPPATERLSTAMSLLADTGALIIDVRNAPGGEPAGVANAIGHLVGERTPTVRTIDPADANGGTTFYAEPKSPAFIDKPVFLLIDGETGSGAEEFAYDLQAMKRATLVGETTYGAATPGGYRPLAGGFAAFIPMQVVNNTITGANWEGVGVHPDVEAPADQALTVAHRLAIEAILETAEGLPRAIAEEGMETLGQ
ncbi:S41 family peptidase [Hyphomonas sp. WL0036]|uniref:S41 family peptidase n=1 Tax=Hyphomonas sediminis TaxID=2866160 RepID=UPI001C7EA518|nr:S41 family peptidase [Hyphomonas sediminis]MBY9067541.1 S41 family peptidase [Hyphomonas sediminis]